MYVVCSSVWRASRAVRILQCQTKRTISVCLLLSVNCNNLAYKHTKINVANLFGIELLIIPSGSRFQR